MVEEREGSYMHPPFVPAFASIGVLNQQCCSPQSQNSNAAILQSGPEIPQSVHARDGQASKRPYGVPHFLGTDLGAGHADVRDAFECPSGLPHFLSTDVGAEHADVRDALHSSLVQRKCPLDILQKIPCSSSVLSSIFLEFLRSMTNSSACILGHTCTWQGEGARECVKPLQRKRAIRF